MALADVYDAISSKRVYKPAFPREVCWDIINEGRGTHFDPRMVDIFNEEESFFWSIVEEYRDFDRDPAVKEGKGIHLNNSPSSQSGNAEEQAKRERWEEELSRVLDELCGDEEGLEEMIAAFLSELPCIRHRSALLLAEGKTAEAAREFHKLKGTLSYLAGTEERELARRAEAEARQGVLSPGARRSGNWIASSMPSTVFLGSGERNPPAETLIFLLQKKRLSPLGLESIMPRNPTTGGYIMNPKFARRMIRFQESDLTPILRLAANPEVISFAGGLPAPELFPVEAMKKIAVRVLDEHGKRALQYSSTEGHLPLREKNRREDQQKSENVPQG